MVSWRDEIIQDVIYVTSTQIYTWQIYTYGQQSKEGHVGSSKVKTGYLGNIDWLR